MTRTGTWFVMCERARAVPVRTIEPRIAKLRDVKVRDAGETLWLDVHDRLTGHDAEISVTLSTEDHVPIEAAEFAERVRRPELAAFDARYELLWDIRLSDEVYNVLAVTAETLQKACDGVIYDVTNGRIV